MKNRELTTVKNQNQYFCEDHWEENLREVWKIKYVFEGAVALRNVCHRSHVKENEKKIVNNRKLKLSKIQNST